MGNVLVNDASLQDVANAIREKNGLETKYKPAEMGQAVRDIPSGGKEPVIEELSITENGVYNAPEGVDGYNPISVNVPSGGGDLPPEALVITGNCRYRFANNGWNWFIENYGDRITTIDINEANYMFDSCSLSEIPFSLNFNNRIGSNSLSSLFNNCINLTKVPIINNVGYTSMSGMFKGSYRLRYIDDFVNDTWKFDGTYGFSGDIFESCYSLRICPIESLKKIKNGTNNKPASSPYSNNLYYYTFRYCYNINYINELPVIASTSTSNLFSYTFMQCGRLNSMTFETEDGMPIIENWKSQTIDLSVNVGFVPIKENSVGYNSGITADKEVTDAESYEALKNNPDWFTTKIEYSRYNHDSAVETINSLPDTSAYLASAGGTNTVKFKGQSGELTDGGAINTLTEEEIAVAAAKGWTVTLV